MVLIDQTGAGALPSGGRIAVIAGEGQLPLDVASQLARKGQKPFIVIFGRREETAPGLLDFDHQRLPLEEALGLIALLKRHGVTHAVLAGGIVRRPRWSALRPRRQLLRLVFAAVRGLRKGDDGLLRVVVRLIEESGIRVLGVHELVPDLLASPGPMTAARPTAEDRRDLAAAMEAARAIGALDIGQAAVAVGGRVIAMEGIEGTDGLLERVQALRGHGRIAGRTRGALVKCAKPRQELRADLPTIGPDTVLRAAAAGLAGIGVQSGRSLILQKKQTVEDADRLGLFIVGLD